MAHPTSSTPLLSAQGSSTASQVDQESLKHVDTITPLPKKQLFLLALIRFAEPISYTVTFPFINEMIKSVGIANPGYLSGAVEGVFNLAQLSSVYYWGSLSDRIGRRPVLLIGLSTIAFFTVCFGLSRSLFMILFFRFLVGANGNSASIKSAIAELTDSTNEGLGFTFMPLAWNVGAILAPIIGGFLARPAEQFPGIFGRWPVFTTFPYLLPCIAAACITITVWILAYLLFDETLMVGQPISDSARTQSPASSSNTLPYISKNDIPRMERSASFVSDVVEPIDAGPEDIVRMRPMEILSDPIIWPITVSYAFLAFISASMDVVYLVWMFTPIPNGGLGFATHETGLLLSGGAAFGFVVNLFIFPFLQHQLGTVKLYRTAMSSFVVHMALYPVVSQVAKWEAVVHPIGRPGLATTAGVACMILVKSIAGMAWTCNTILVCRSAPSRTSLGGINGITQMVASSAKAAGPSIATVVFALSTDEQHRLLGGQFIWVYLVILTVFGARQAFQVQEGRGVEI